MTITTIYHHHHYHHDVFLTIHKRIRTVSIFLYFSITNSLRRTFFFSFYFSDDDFDDDDDNYFEQICSFWLLHLPSLLISCC